jgi:hypothetical protein
MKQSSQAAVAACIVALALHSAWCIVNNRNNLHARHTLVAAVTTTHNLIDPDAIDATSIVFLLPVESGKGVAKVNSKCVLEWLHSSSSYIDLVELRGERVIVVNAPVVEIESLLDTRLSYSIDGAGRRCILNTEAVSVPVEIAECIEMLFGVNNCSSLSDHREYLSTSPVPGSTIIPLQTVVQYHADELSIAPGTMSYVKIGGGKSIVLDPLHHYNNLGTYISHLWLTREPFAGVMLLAEKYPADTSAMAHELRRLVDDGMMIVVPKAHRSASPLFDKQRVVAASHITKSEATLSQSIARSHTVCGSALVQVKCVERIIDHARSRDDDDTATVHIVAKNILLDSGAVVSDTGFGELAAEIYIYTLTGQQQH